MQRLIAVAAAAGVAIACCCGVRSDEPVHAAERVAKTQPANLTRTTVVLEGQRPLILGAFAIDGDGENGARGTIQPGIAIWDADSAAMLRDRQLNVPPTGNFTTATSSAGHDAPSLVRTASGGILALYGAASTYVGYHPPSAWQCEGSLACEPFKFARSASNDASVVDTLASSPEYLLPTVGLSEASYATLGSTTIIAGQQQPSSRYGQAGSQAYITLHDSSNSAVFDTTSGPWAFTSSHEPPGDGLEMPTLTPSDDAVADVAILSAQSGQGSMQLQLGDQSCSITTSGHGGAAAVAQRIAQSFASACAQLSRQFDAMQVTYDPVLMAAGAPLAPAIVGIVTRDGISEMASATVSVRCSGSLVCGTARGPNTVALVRGSGLHRHFLFGGVLVRGPYVFYLMDVEQLTGSWYGRGQSSLALALACFRAREPQGDVWTWTDCAGGNAFTLKPGTPPVARLGTSSPYLIHAPADGYSGDMAPYVFDWSMRGQQNARGIPVIAAVSAAFASDGNVVLVHGCETPSRVMTACYVLYDEHTGETRRAGTIVLPSGGGSLASISLLTRGDGTVEAGVLTGEGDRWGCSSAGVCFLTFRYDGAQNRWFPLAHASLGGREYSGFPGSLTVSGDRFVLQIHRATSNGYDVETQMRA